MLCNLIGNARNVVETQTLLNDFKTHPKRVNGQRTRKTLSPLYIYVVVGYKQLCICLMLNKYCKYCIFKTVSGGGAGRGGGVRWEGREGREGGSGWGRNITQNKIMAIHRFDVVQTGVENL